MPFETLYVPEPNSGCWLWIGALWAGRRYGQVRKNGKNWSAHVFSYVTHKGKIPNGLVVRHTCDVMLCVNPEHLILGSHLDNAQDRKSRGRSAKQVGETNGFARLSALQISTIRLDTRSQRVIAADYNVAQTTISAIKRRLTWGHI